MKIKIPALLTGLLLISSIFASGGHQTAGEKSFLIIVHSENPAESITREAASNLFLKKSKKWKVGEFTESVIPVDQSERSEVREQFTSAIFKKSISAIKSYWQRMIFSGRDFPPDELASDEAVIDFVKANRGAIGYVSLNADLTGVKELLISADSKE